MSADITINPDNVTTGSPVEGGCCYTSFDSSVELPTDATTRNTVAETFENLGELSEDGYTKSVATTSQKFKGWHGTVLLTKISDEENTFKAAFTEIDRGTVAKLRYGADNVTLDESGKITKIAPTRVPDAKVPLVFYELLSNGRLRCTVVPRATIDSIDDESHANGSLLLYGMTFTANEDSDGHPYYIYEAEPVTAKAAAEGGDAAEDGGEEADEGAED